MFAMNRSRVWDTWFAQFFRVREKKVKKTRDITGAFVRVSACDECRQSRLAAAQLAGGWLSSLATTTAITTSKSYEFVGGH